MFMIYSTLFCALFSKVDSRGRVQFVNNSSFSKPSFLYVVYLHHSGPVRNMKAAKHIFSQPPPLNNKWPQQETQTKKGKQEDAVLACHIFKEI